MHNVRISGEPVGIPVGKIVCLGRNYMEHVKEMKSETSQAPVLFIKPSTAIIKDGDPIVYPPFSKLLHHEVEITLLIGKDGRNIAPGGGDDYILGYGIGLDMTLRDVQSEAKKRGLPWSVAKGFDSSAPVSDFIAKERVADSGNLTFRCSVNGSLRQKGSSRDMIMSASRFVEYVSTIFTLERGDILFTGTPEGVGEVHPGDTLTAELDGYVSISNPVVQG